MSNQTEFKEFSSLQELYDSMPTVECLGLCYDECTAVAVFPVEACRITRSGGKVPYFEEDERRCAALSADGKCSNYNNRPFICRAFGATQNGIECQHNCKASRKMSEAEMLHYLSELTRLSGGQKASLLLKPRLAIEYYSSISNK